MKNKNKFYSLVYTFTIIALFLGGIGGNLQVSRLLPILLLPLIFVRLHTFIRGHFFNYKNQIIFFSLQLIFICLLSLVWSVDKVITLGFSLVVAINLLPLIIVGFMTDHEILQLRRSVPIAWGIAASLVLPIAFYEILTDNHFLLDDHARGGGIGSLIPFAAGFFGNLNNLSLFLFFCFFGLSFHFGRIEKSKILNYFMIGVGLMIAVVLVINIGRGAIISLFMLVGIIISVKLTVKTFFLSCFLLIFLGGAIINSNDKEVLNFIDYFMLRFTDFSSDTETNDGRSAIILAGISGLYTSYGLGVGAGTSTAYLSTFQNLTIPNAHNILIEWALSFGFIGVVSLLWFIFQTFVVIRKNLNVLHRRLVISFLILIPIFGVVQSTLLNFTYFWMALTTMTIFSRPITQYKSD